MAQLLLVNILLKIVDAMIDRAGPVNDLSSFLSILDLHTGDIDIQVLNLFLPGNIVLP